MGRFLKKKLRHLPRQYAKELQEEKDEQRIDALVDAREHIKKEMNLYMEEAGQDLNSKIQSGQIKIV